MTPDDALKLKNVFVMTSDCDVKPAVVRCVRKGEPEHDLMIEWPATEDIDPFRSNDVFATESEAVARALSDAAYRRDYHSEEAIKYARIAENLANKSGPMQIILGIIPDASISHVRSNFCSESGLLDADDDRLAAKIRDAVLSSPGTPPASAAEFLAREVDRCEKAGNARRLWAEEVTGDIERLLGISAEFTQ